MSKNKPIAWAADSKPQLMGRVSGRKPAGKWVLTWWRAVGEFKKGERKMMQPDRLRERSYMTEIGAKKSRCQAWRSPYKAFVHRKGRAPKRITEIEINYSAE